MSTDTRQAETGTTRRPGGRNAQPTLGLIDGAKIRQAFILFVYAAAGLLFVLSVIGTTYGGSQLPLPALDRLWYDIRTTPVSFGLGLLGQLALTIMQWGAMHLALNEDRRWGVLWILAVLVSAGLNITAYYAPVVASGAPPLLVILVIVVADVLTELIFVRRTAH